MCMQIIHIAMIVIDAIARVARDPTAAVAELSRVLGAVVEAVVVSFSPGTLVDPV